MGYLILKLFATYSNLLSVVCMVFAYWHNKLLNEAIDEAGQSVVRVAALDIMQELRTCPPEEATERYTETCAICLGSWEPTDTVKITPCGHAFHDECIGSWLKSSHTTCALCRCDLAEALRSSATLDQQANPAERAEVRGSDRPPDTIGAF